VSNDLAAFRPDDIFLIYGDRPRCFFTLLHQWVDAHHILGRGFQAGVRKSNPDREIFSSPYNFAPLQRDVHNGPLRDHPLVRLVLLDKAAEKVNEAVRRGSYEQTELDLRFLSYAEEWRQDVIKHYLPEL